MTSKATLDHTVINVGYQMDDAKIAFENLGFQLTERGYHSLGSINHLMMFGTDYAELIGLPAKLQGQQTGRADIANAPLGINGLVFKAHDVDETFAHLQQLGMDGDPPKSFSRPVKLADGTQDARFRTVAVRNGVFPGGRVYFCEHGTPELVWRLEWQKHQCGVLSIPEFVIASTTPELEADKFACLLDSPVSSDGNDESHTVDFVGGQICIMNPAGLPSAVWCLGKCHGRARLNLWCIGTCARIISTEFATSLRACRPRHRLSARRHESSFEKRLSIACLNLSVLRAEREQA